MTNVDLLKNVIETKGIKLCKIGEAIGVSDPTLRRKISGESEFLQSEIVKMRDFLSLSDDEVRDIFLR